MTVISPQLNKCIVSFVIYQSVNYRPRILCEREINKILLLVRIYPNPSPSPAGRGREKGKGYIYKYYHSKIFSGTNHSHNPSCWSGIGSPCQGGGYWGVWLWTQRNFKFDLFQFRFFLQGSAITTADRPIANHKFPTYFSLNASRQPPWDRFA